MVEEEKRIKELNLMLQKQISVLSQQNQEEAQADLKNEQNEVDEKSNQKLEEEPI